MKKIIVFLLFSVFAFCGELKIATYNVENLFDGENNGNEYSDYKVCKCFSEWDEEKYNQKIKQTAEIIKELNVDIIALQEIENKEVLKKLAGLSGYEFFEFSASKNSPVGVGFLSKIKPWHKEIYRAKEIKTRDILRLDFEFDGVEIALFTTHFLSAKNSFVDRRKNAIFLGESIRGTKNAVVLGDFNSDYGKGSLLREIIDTQNYTDLWDFVWFKKSSHITGRALDHILLSSELFGFARLGYKKDSFKVFRSSKNSSDHDPIYFVLTSDKDKVVKKEFKQIIIDEQKSQPKKEFSFFKKEPKSVSIDEIYGQANLKNEVKIQNAVVSFIDKKGFAIAKDGRGVFIFGDNQAVQVGDKVDILVKKAKIYNQNYEISEFEILKNHGKNANFEKHLYQGSLENIRSGDVVGKLKGDVENGVIKTKFGEFLIYGANGKVKNGKNLEFENAFFTIYKGKKEFIVK